MFFKIVKNDCSRKKIITATVFIFITLAVILGASATNIIANLVQSMEEFERCSNPSDFTQMHLGTYDQSVIDEFTYEEREHVAVQETMQLINIEGMNVYYNENKTLSGTIQDISFVVQNEKLDFILDLDNQKLEVQQGEVAVPIYFMQECQLEIGDTIRLECEGMSKTFLITDYARDFETNSTFTTIKRFVINQADYEELLNNEVGEIEYLIQFKVHPDGDVKALQTAYIEKGMPGNGPYMNGSMFALFNAMSDAMTAMIIILISLLLIVIAGLCIRLTFLATLDEDIREIGVMKAMGISKKDIKKVYLTKYRVMSVVAGVTGYLISFTTVNLFNGNMRLYLSSQATGNLQYILSLIAPIFVYAMIVLYCKKVLRRIDNISAVEALRSDFMVRGRNKKYSFPLLKNTIFSTNIYMGIRDVFKRSKLYSLLLIIFIVCVFIIIVPLKLYNTVNSPEFSTYMGIGKSDMRIDLRRTETITQEFAKLEEELENDPEIEKFAPYITCAYQIKNAEGSWDYINIEIGDFSVFELNYLEGIAPRADGEIALSYANAAEGELNKKVGDEVLVRVGNVEKAMKVCGIYQDITNGGRTAKATTSLELNEEAILWYITSIDVMPGVDIKSKMDYYQSKYKSAQVNNIQEYTQQTLGNIISQLGIIVVSGMAITIIIVILITVLFLKMLLSKDMSQIAIMRSVGLTSKSVRNQYMAAAMMVLVAGIILGVLIANFLGEFLVSMALASMGAAKIEFVEVIWQTWIACPLAMVIVVSATILSCCKVTVKEDISVVLRS